MIIIIWSYGLMGLFALTDTSLLILSRGLVMESHINSYVLFAEQILH